MASERLNIPIVPEFGGLAAAGTGRGPHALAFAEHGRGLWSLAQRRSVKETIMLNWAIAFLIIALIAGLLGSGVIAGTAFAAAKVIFVIALLAFLVSGVVEVSRRGTP
jgi:uncharacterized membrane protein YtjA (UPF0391 family)